MEFLGKIVGSIIQKRFKKNHKLFKMKYGSILKIFLVFPSWKMGGSVTHLFYLQEKSPNTFRLIKRILWINILNFNKTFQHSILKFSQNFIDLLNLFGMKRMFHWQFMEFICWWINYHPSSFNYPTLLNEINEAKFYTWFHIFHPLRVTNFTNWWTPTCNFARKTELEEKVLEHKS